LKVWYGLGFCNTIKQYGYGWIEPRFDWERLQFKAEVTQHALFGNEVLRGQYLRRGGQVRAFFDLVQRLELALTWLQREELTGRQQQRLLSWMAYIYLEQFRRDVLGSIRQEISVLKREEATQGKVGFCYEYFEGIMSEGVHLVSGNRCDYKEVHDLGRYLFEYNDGRSRKHWGDKPYRKLFQRSSEGLRTVIADRDQAVGMFRGEVYRLLYRLHWILPYPTNDVLLQTTKRGWRMWYSVVIGEVTNKEGSRQKRWAWGRKGWRAGQVEMMPEWTEWSREEWERWLRIRRAGE